MENCVITNTKEETMELGFRLGSKWLGKNKVVGLEGELGAGKTTFVKGLAKAMGVDQNIKSPTFVLLKEYSGKKGLLVHVDAYRLDGIKNDDLGLGDYFDRAIIIVEWYQLIENILPRVDVVVKFEHVAGGGRKICIRES
ncbi:MAG: tRNA (adenosine(37)-N6)-threonylcarbamoyltransferase complex ATPase subunit type 1 TsaE [Patescibacteria group bacterium]